MSEVELMEQLTSEEINVNLTFLNRVQLQGQEAETLVMLKQKLRQMIQQPKPLKDGDKK